MDNSVSRNNRPAIPGRTASLFRNTAEQRIWIRQLLSRRDQQRATLRPWHVRGWAPTPMRIYIQDSWKVTRKLTFDYGLRWDYAILWKEQYGRMQNAAFDLPNSLIGGRLGTRGIRGHLQVQLRQRLPLCHRTAPRSRLPDHTQDCVPRGAAPSPTRSISDQAGLNSSAGDFYSMAAPAYGASRGTPERWESLRARQPVRESARPWPNFSPQFPVPAAPGVIPPSSPFVSIAPNAGPAAAHFPVEHRLPAGDYAQPGGGSFLCGQSRRLVGCAAAGRPELQRADAAGA